MFIRYSYARFLKFLRYIRVKAITRFAFSSTVVEVGSGDLPCLMADVFVDRYLTEPDHRHGGRQFMRLPGGTCIQADIMRLPFKDDAFDHGFCSHIFEHLEDPAAALREMQRVSRRGGYIEVPNWLLEQTLPAPSHLWECRRDGAALVMTRKTKHGGAARARLPPMLAKRAAGQDRYRQLYCYFAHRPAEAFIEFAYDKDSSLRCNPSEDPYYYTPQPESCPQQHVSNVQSAVFRFGYMLMRWLKTLSR